MKLQINVTKEILEKSKFCTEDAAFNCAIALAVRDVFPDAAVFSDEISLFCRREKNPYIKTLLPAIALSFINKFDYSTSHQRALLVPISFEIDVPDSALEYINIDEVTELLKNHPTLSIL